MQHAAAPSSLTLGRQLTNAALATALKNKVEFTQGEWDAFGIEDLSSADWIRVGSVIYRPSDGILASGVAPLSGVSFLQVQAGTLDAECLLASAAIPNACLLLPLPSAATGLYPRPQDDEVVVVVNTVQGMVTKIEFEDVDLDFSSDRVDLIGVSPCLLAPLSRPLIILTDTLLLLLCLPSSPSPNTITVCKTGTRSSRRALPQSSTRAHGAAKPPRPCLLTSSIWSLSRSSCCPCSCVFVLPHAPSTLTTRAHALHAATLAAGVCDGDWRQLLSARRAHQAANCDGRRPVSHDNSSSHFPRRFLSPRRPSLCQSCRSPKGRHVCIRTHARMHACTPARS